MSIRKIVRKKSGDVLGYVLGIGKGCQPHVYVIKEDGSTIL